MLSLLLAYCMILQKSLHLSVPLFLIPSFYTLPAELFSFRGQGWGLTGSLMCFQYSDPAIIWKPLHRHDTKNNSPIWAIAGLIPQ